MIALFVQQVSAQQVDTWFMAGKGINSPTNGISLYLPNPITTLAQDGDPVTTWYDIVYYSEQNAVQHPDPVDYPNDPFGTPDGFDYPFPNSGGNPLFLTPMGSIPGVPTVRRNPTDNMNFNPVVNFDGSGTGQALHFRSNSRRDITVFIVFKARGAGNSAETQRLLFGGDVDVHHRSANSNDWTTNLSLGVADGNTFSVGRTWNPLNMLDPGEFYVSGGIDLLGEPSIGAFNRVVGVNAELLITHVNGIQDISINRNHPLADNTLFYFNRLGKHFNSNDSNRNLTGDIAEVLLADFSLGNNLRQRVQSYLAIKYGITLNAVGSLGSINGNTSYNYLASDGTVIWTVDPNYRHDIAGLGKDRYKDVGGALSLRYNIDQRISKSVNSDAIVTMSTNTDFSTDNLDLTRTEIDGQIVGQPDGTPNDHNFLMWGNDNQSINSSALELPPGLGITSRIGREWRIQAVRTPGVNPIQGVSVRVDLSGSDILTNSGTCAIKLLIDTDGNGDFTDGPITVIEATLVDGSGNAYFDGVDFQHLDVFTIGFGDTTDPTASNPATTTVCDTPPLVDPSIVNDEADNCAVDSVTFQGEVSDGNTNPETITRIYRITDTAGNFIDVTHTILVYTTPVITNQPDIVGCAPQVFPPINGIGLISAAYYDAPNGGGNSYNPGDPIPSSGTYYIYDETASTPNCSAETSFNVTLTLPPTASAGPDDTICGLVDYTLTGAMANNFDNLLWTHNGSGNFTDATALNAIYEPSLLDVGSTVTLTLTASSINCPDAVDSMELTITFLPIVDAGSDEEICEGDTLDLAASGTPPSASNTSSLSWATAGDGSFDDPAALLPAYTPGVNDIANGSVVLTLTGNGNGSCPATLDAMKLTITPVPIVDAGSDEEICEGTALDLATSGTQPSASNTGSLSWATAGDGSFDDPTALLPLYTPGLNDIINGSVVLTLTGNGNGSCTDTIDTMTLTITPASVVNAGSDEEICEGDSHDLSISGTAPSASNTSSLLWSTPGDGNFDDATLLAPTYTPGAADILAGSIVLTLTANGNGSCAPVQDTMTLTITPAPVVDAGSDEEICEGTTLDLATSTIVPSESNTGSLSWATAGDGTFDDATILMPVYTPGVNDIVNGSVVLTLTGNGNGSCPATLDVMTLTITPAPTVDAGSDEEICEGTTLDLAASGTTPSASNTSSLSWATSGDGSFDDPTALLPVYTPGVNDIANGSVVLTLTANGNGSCPPFFDAMALTINSIPFIGVDVYSDPTTCGGSDGSISLIFGNVPDGVYDIFHDAGVFNAVPVNAGSAVVNGLPEGNYNNLRITVAGCTSTDDPDVTLTAPAAPVIDPVTDVSACNQYVLPAITGTDLTGNQAYYDMPGGGGNQYNPLTIFNIVGTTTLYIYDQNGTCSNQESFDLTINNTPLADAPADVESCDSYVLPALANGNYFDAPNGGGNALIAGDAVTTTTTLYVFSPGTGSCPDVENSFTVTINNTPAIDPLADQTACDAYTLPAITGSNLSGNEAYFTGTGGTGTQYAAGQAVGAGTYYIYDETGTTPNCSDEVSFTVTINNTPDVFALADVEACDSFVLPAINGNNLSGNQAYYDGPGGTGTQYSPMDVIATSGTYYIYDETGTIPNCFDQESFVITITPSPTVDAGSDEEICEGATLDLAASGTTPSASNTSSLSWATAGDGSFDDATALLPIYTPGINDIANGSVVLTLTGNGNGSCPLVFDTMTLTITPAPIVEAGSDEEVCEGAALDLASSGTPPSASNTSSLSWATAGDGSFDDPTILLPVYTPGVNDIANGSVVLTLTGNGNGSCPLVFDTMALTINSIPFIGVDVYSDPTTCGGSDGSISLIFGNVPDGVYDIFHDAGVFNAVPVNAGSAVVNGLPEGNYNNLRITVAGCTSTDDPDVTLTAPVAPVIDPIPDVSACDQYVLPAIAGTNLTGNQAYYDMPGGGGNQYNPLTIFNIVGTTTLYIYDQNGTCSDQESFDLTIDATNEAGTPTDMDLCEGDATTYDLNAQLAGADAGGTWTDVNDAFGNGANSVVPDPANMDFSALGDGSYDFTYTVSSTGACPDDTATVSVNIFEQPTIANAGTDIEQCDTPDFTMAANVPAVGTGIWTQTAGPPLIISSPNDPATNVTGLPVGQNAILRWTITNGTCPDSFDQVTITNYQQSLADAPTDVESCDSYVLPALANGNYFDAPNGGGNAYAANDAITTTTTLYVFSPGTGSCPDVENSFTVTIN
ncbi:MAG: hypothetical protein RIB79_18040, partial [Allomuricauda sp.]